MFGLTTLGILAMVVLGVAWLASRSVFARASRHVATISYSLTFFFHVIQGVTETTTRLPLDAPFFASPDDAGLQKSIGACFVPFLIGVVLQVRRLRVDRPLPMGVVAA